MKWWAYKHVNGAVLVKRLLSTEDLIEARESDFVSEVMQPFEASSRDDAEKRASSYFNQGETQ